MEQTYKWQCTRVINYNQLHWNVVRETNLADVTTNDQWIRGNDNKREPPIQHKGENK